MEQEGGDGRRLLPFSALKQWKTKSITARSKMRGHGEMPALWYVLFHAKRLHRCM
jgi:hypothetical protein